MKLPKAEQNLTEWQTATEALIMAAFPASHSSGAIIVAVNLFSESDTAQTDGATLDESGRHHVPMLFFMKRPLIWRLRLFGDKLPIRCGERANCQSVLTETI
jgi:hypothetical protein